METLSNRMCAWIELKIQNLPSTRIQMLIDFAGRGMQTSNTSDDYQFSNANYYLILLRVTHDSRCAKCSIIMQWEVMTVPFKSISKVGRISSMTSLVWKPKKKTFSASNRIVYPRKCKFSQQKFVIRLIEQWISFEMFHNFVNNFTK